MAAQIGWATARRPRGALAEPCAAAEAFQVYLDQLPEGPARRRLPTHAQLRAAGRHDLRYALQVRVVPGVRIVSCAPPGILGFLNYHNCTLV